MRIEKLMNLKDVVFYGFFSFSVLLAIVCVTSLNSLMGYDNSNVAVKNDSQNSSVSEIQYEYVAEQAIIDADVNNGVDVSNEEQYAVAFNSVEANVATKEFNITLGAGENISYTNAQGEYVSSTLVQFDTGLLKNLTEENSFSISIDSQSLQLELLTKKQKDGFTTLSGSVMGDEEYGFEIWYSVDAQTGESTVFGYIDTAEGEYDLDVVENQPGTAVTFSPADFAA